MRAEIIAYMIYSEGPEYPEYVMHFFRGSNLVMILIEASLGAFNTTSAVLKGRDVSKI